MDVNERIDYLKPFIGKEAPFICMFVFQDQTHVKGVLADCSDEEIRIKVQENEEIKRQRNDLINVFIS